jgi:hypothetical protein
MNEMDDSAFWVVDSNFEVPPVIRDSRDTDNPPQRQKYPDHNTYFYYQSETLAPLTHSLAGLLQQAQFFPPTI